MILDEQLPGYDVSMTKHRVVAASPEITWQAARDLDFMTARTPLTGLSMWARALPARLRGQARPAPASLRLAQGEGLPGWLSLGERHGEEIAFGAVGVFWQATPSWRAVPPAEFANFDEPGYGKIGCSFSVRPYGATRTLLSFECRTAITDPASRRAFARYWRPIQPVVAHFMRATLATIAADAERRAAAVRVRAGAAAASGGQA